MPSNIQNFKCSQSLVEVANPYLEEFTKFRSESTPDVWPNVSLLDDVFIQEYQLRNQLTRQYAWAIPSNQALAMLVALSPIVEIGAGAGYWASLVSQANGDIVAFDLFPDPECNTQTGSCSFFDVRPGDAATASLYPDRTLFLCWPPYTSPCASDALSAYGGNTLVYVGEGPGGCTADDRFFDLLDQQWRLDDHLALPCWEGVHDTMYVYRRTT